ncbi:nitrous oxide reductase accessory protein NosL [Gracilimonas sp. Q87]|uniref:nitrous oxide reductase accessory protein NosL n=1 Tax=Gracilimonas sp. Q87 TaxID=3384766 RepID=UPI0039844AAE
MRLFRNIKFMVSAVVLLLFATACSQEPVEIHYASDECAHCKMMITDEQFAAQLVTEKGKALKFDAIECMAVYHRENKDDLSGSKLWVSNYNDPGTWLDAYEAQYVKSEVINSPMGESLLALPTKEAAEEHIEERPGRLLLWDEVSQIEMNLGTGMQK